MFRDINPQAPFHVLVVPKRHIPTSTTSRRPTRRSSERWSGARRRWRPSTATPNVGYRTVFNCNADAGQTVFHLHLHVLAGRGLSWPPG